LLDKRSVNRFWQDAVNIFETATNGARDAGEGELNILIDDSGALRIVSEPGWRPEALAAHYGAKTVYQVKRTADGVRVEGQSRGTSCTLRSEKRRPIATYEGYIRHVCAASSSSCLLLPR
jgi:hypothetical protein